MMPPMAVTEPFKLPEHFDLEPELREQLSSRPGHQRCIEGAGELLLVVHEVPRPGIAQREALFFWKGHEGRWRQQGGTGLSGLGELLDRYEVAIDGHEQAIDHVATAAEVFAILRHSGALVRSTRHLVQALEHLLAIDPDDRAVRGYRDWARDIERAADLLHTNGRVMLEFWHAQRAEQQSRASARLNRITFRMSLVVGFFLPLAALGGWFGLNGDLPRGVELGSAAILLAGVALGVLGLWFEGRDKGKSADG